MSDATILNAPPKLDLTVVIPVKNEERNLPKCLARLADFAAVVVVDSDSSDRTPEIAAESGATIVNFRWKGGFPKKRNWLLAYHAFKTEWVLFLDADEFLTPQFCAELRNTLPQSQRRGYWLNYNNVFLGRKLTHGIRQRKLALMRRGAGQYENVEDALWSHYDMEIHEHLILDGEAGEILSPIVHESGQSIHQVFAKHNEYASWEANKFVRHGGRDRMTGRQRLKYSSMNQFWFSPAYFLTEYFFRGGVLDGYPGFAHAIMKAIYFFIIYLKINELQACRGSMRQAFADHER